MSRGTECTHGEAKVTDILLRQSWAHSLKHQYAWKLNVTNRKRIMLLNMLPVECVVIFSKRI